MPRKLTDPGEFDIIRKIYLQGKPPRYTRPLTDEEKQEQAEAWDRKKRKQRNIAK